MPDEDKRPGVDRRRTNPAEEAKRQRRHREARGKSASLSDLARELPTDDDIANFKAYLVIESDRGVAIMGAALVELALKDAIRARFADPGGETVRTWFEGPTAPFQAFSAKISLGRALAIYGPKMEESLTITRHIRNAFAHRISPLRFDHPAVEKACMKLRTRSLDETNPRIVFAASCVALAMLLGDDAEERGGQVLPVTFP